jgi:hypothetical protein
MPFTSDDALNLLSNANVLCDGDAQDSLAVLAIALGFGLSELPVEIRSDCASYILNLVLEALDTALRTRDL